MPTTLEPVQVDEPGYVSGRGGFFNTVQSVKSMIRTRLSEAIERVDQVLSVTRIDHLHGVPEALTEMEVTRLMRERAHMDGSPLCFIGAGAYEHHIPAAVWDITTRGEYYSAYTPYQAEASQGTLQTIYEYQTMITELTGLDVSNASLYDGASALAEAALMSVRANRKVKSGHVLLAPGVNPLYDKVAESITGGQGLTFEWLPRDSATGNLDFDKLPEGTNPVAVVMQQPTFAGTLEDVDRLTDWAHAQGAFAIGIANPTSLAVLKAPGHWGSDGADIAIGEGQPLGVPLSSGGPYFGYMTCKQQHVRQMPGRIIGRTVDNNTANLFQDLGRGGTAVGHGLHHRIAFRMNGAGIQRVPGIADAQESGRLLEGLRAEARQRAAGARDELQDRARIDRVRHLVLHRVRGKHVLIEEPVDRRDVALRGVVHVLEILRHALGQPVGELDPARRRRAGFCFHGVDSLDFALHRS